MNPLYLIERDLLGQAVVELSGAGGLVASDTGGDLEVAAVSQVLGDPAAAEGVGADFAGEGGPAESDPTGSSSTFRNTQGSIVSRSPGTGSPTAASLSARDTLLESTN